MTTRSSPSQPNPSLQSVIAFTEEIHRTGPPGTPADGGEGGAADGEPAHRPVRCAVGDRPLEEVVRLVTLLEGSPRYADTTGRVLRAAALDRPVEEVVRLVAELTRPPRPAESADAAIRAAVEHRDLDEVTRLLALLHRAPQRPHCARVAVSAAVGARTAEELADLLGGLARHDGSGSPPPYTAAEDPSAVPEEPTAAGAGTERCAGPGGTPCDPEGPMAAAADDEWAGQDGGARGPGRLVFWPGWVAAAALVVCGAAHFPLRPDGASGLVYGAALAASALCGALALALVLRAGVTVLVAGSVLPAALAALGYAEGRFAPAGLSRALAVTVAPPSSAGLTAVCAALASLAALSLLLMVQMAERHPAPRPEG
ncbi:hypothetical protein [Streptomyces sp. PsTaAH-124]|uniref:hypothetical protein n=1 Tax=Streptomyces sp. PsTaAH-124 TaxID=1157638 RepID=UPI000381E89A|nr:hypothetical protein [Streptomyces sp. PsTaAH-124]